MKPLQILKGFTCIPLQETIKWKNRELKVVEINVLVIKNGYNVENVFTLDVDIINNRVAVSKELVHYINEIMGQEKSRFFFSRSSFSRGIIKIVNRWINHKN